MLNRIIISIGIGIIGLLAGMLVNYLSDVLPWKRRLVKPFCINCDQPQNPINYFLWPRRCPACTLRRSWRTWLVDLIYLGLSLWSWHFPQPEVGYWLGMLLLIYFGVVVVIDIEHKLIMHPVSLVGAGLALLIGVIRQGWISTMIGGVLGFGVMWLLFLLGEWIMKGLARLRGRTLDDVALGFGDVNLSGVLGLMLGWPLVLAGLVGAILIGGVVSLFYLLLMLALRRYHLFMALPYGPFLVVAAFILLYFGGPLGKLMGG
jgi:leader peptidase (prepilin peptidase)/N-methyltransferase